MYKDGMWTTFLASPHIECLCCYITTMTRKANPHPFFISIQIV